jgi:hypothetical protein
MSTQPHPVVLNIIPQSLPIINMKQSKNEEDKLKSNREYVHRNYQKTIEYKKIAYLNSDSEKIKALLLILYPHITDYDPIFLDTQITSFLNIFKKV